jgi:acetyl esterase/lipase
MKTVIVALVFLAFPLSSSAATFGPYPTQTYVECKPAKPAKGNPAAVFAHGNWANGTDSQANALQVCQGLAAAGIYTISINYRNAYQAVWPAQLADMQLAIRWLRHLGYSRVGVAGTSAGGEIALMAGAVNAPVVSLDTDPKREFDQWIFMSSKPDFVIDISGPADMTMEVNDGTRDGMSPQVPLSLPMAQASMSPVVFIDSRMPPTIVFQGLTDTHTKVDQADELTTILAARQVVYQYQLYGGGHVFAGMSAAEQNACVAEAAQFALALKPVAAKGLCTN